MRELPVRKSIRLKDYDYGSSGYYFITICTIDKLNLFGEIVNGEVQVNGYGAIAENELLSIYTHYDNVIIDKYVVMPNHVHMIVVLKSKERINPFPTKVNVPNIVGKYKAGVTRAVGNAFMRSAIWQRRYHDHIIRDEADYRRIWQYIDENPARWTEDCYFVKGEHL